MLWLRLIEGVLDLDIVKNDVCSKHAGNWTSVDFLTKGKLPFVVEVVDSEVTLVFKEYRAEAIKSSKNGKIRSISIRGQERRIINRISKILRAKRMFISFEEINDKELVANHERKLVWN